MTRGPKYMLTNAPSGNASIGPIAMIALEVPALRAAPAGSEVASAWVERFKAA